MEVLYEDNHIIVVSKCPGEIVQGDKTGDEPLSETIKRADHMMYEDKARLKKYGKDFLGE